jgi:hypothetical protein
VESSERIGARAISSCGEFCGDDKMIVGLTFSCCDAPSPGLVVASLRLCPVQARPAHLPTNCPSASGSDAQDSSPNVLFLSLIF